MKEDIKDVLVLFGIAILMWLLSFAITDALFIWLLKWGFKIGTWLFILGGIIAIGNAISSHRQRMKNKKENENNNTPK